MGNLRNAILNGIKESKEKENSLEKYMLDKALNDLFFADKKPKEELEFINQMFTRGAGTGERIGLHASAIIVSDNEFCYRQQVLSLLFKQNQGENTPVNLKRIYEEGNAIHEKWQRLFIRGNLSKPNLMDRTRLINKYELTFTPDAIIEINGKKYVVEIKSMNAIAFKNATTHSSGSKQCQLYMHFLGIPNGFVLADDKNSQSFKIFSEKYNYEKVLPFISRLNEVKEMKENYLKYGELPKRKCKNCTVKKAKECNMLDACFNIGMGQIPLDNKNIKLK